MEVLSEHRQIHVVHMSHGDESKPLAVEIEIFTSSPWFYHRLVEKGKPIVFSSRESLPPEEIGKGDSWEKSGIHAGLMPPLRVGGQEILRAALVRNLCF
jgi:hypothetical protein